jgi:GH15 family glucan-1,4-alpha-glucosidase
MSTLPIEDHALVSDCNTSALVTTGGSVDWLCLPRFDSPAMFARILDDDAGYFSIAPEGGFETSRRYVDATMVLETTFTTATGAVVLTDCLAVGRNEVGHELGAGSPRVLVRVVRCTRGEVRMVAEYEPRPEFGLIRPLMFVENEHVMTRGGADRLILSTPVPMEVEGSRATARFTMHEGDSAGFALQHRNSWEEPPGALSQEAIAEHLDNTIAGWRTWSELHQGYDGPWRDLVHHSGRVLYALTYHPTGAIVAAPTTSLPESVGGERNWDYRYAWVRDASFTMEALWVAACPDEAKDFFTWMAGAAAAAVSEGADLQIMFGVGGRHDLAERKLEHLRGWRDSAPVRVGNGAWEQRQLDVYGELLSAAYILKDYLGDIDAATRRFLVDVADAAAARWQESDQGIWEVRGGPRHYLYSKLMCWVALDRAVALADRLDAADRVDAWSKTRGEIRDAILEHGWSDQIDAFTQALGSQELDASALVMPLVGFLPANDPRVLATIDAIEGKLTDDRGLVFRYVSEDGLEGDEGTFLLCTFWLAQAQAMAGEVGRARETFERAIAYANDVGLLAEEVDPKTGGLLGNFPQAFSHIGLVNAAWAIAQAEKR